MSDKEQGELDEKSEKESPENNGNRQTAPEEEFDVNSLNLIIYRGQLLSESRFLEKHPLTKNSETKIQKT